MILRVLRALEESKAVRRRLICGPSQEILSASPILDRLLQSQQVSWIAPQPTPSLSALHALKPLLPEGPVLLTTADHALLTREIVDGFWSAAMGSPAELVAGVAPCKIVNATYPEMRRTPLRFRDGAFCGCNLFAFKTEGSLAATQFWRRVEENRKRPMRIAGALGLGTILRYLLRRLSISDALAALSQKIGVPAAIVPLPYPEAAIDVDTLDDWRFAERLVNKDRPHASL